MMMIRTLQQSSTYRHGEISFYADDGQPEHEDPTKLQQDLDAMKSLFGKVRLQANEKTTFMILGGTPAPKALSGRTYKNVVTKRGSYDAWRKKKIICWVWGKHMQQGCLKWHLQTIKF